MIMKKINNVSNRKFKQPIVISRNFRNPLVSSSSWHGPLYFSNMMTIILRRPVQYCLYVCKLKTEIITRPTIFIQWYTYIYGFFSFTVYTLSHSQLHSFTHRPMAMSCVNEVMPLRRSYIKPRGQTSRTHKILSAAVFVS